jgi:hypothetical protein
MICQKNEKQLSPTFTYTYPTEKILSSRISKKLTIKEITPEDPSSYTVIIIEI